MYIDIESGYHIEIKHNTKNSNKKREQQVKQHHYNILLVAGKQKLKAHILNTRSNSTQTHTQTLNNNESWLSRQRKKNMNKTPHV